MEQNEPNVKFTSNLTKATHLIVSQNDIEEMDKRYSEDDYGLITQYINAMYTGKGKSYKYFYQSDFHALLLG